MQAEIEMTRSDSQETFIGRLKRKPSAGYWVLSLHGNGQDFKSEADAQYAVDDFKGNLPSTHKVTKVSFY